ncbi:facilitated trehalose transporter Tret1-like [Penaeus japonicus]|uniref:facilitated trehalose transporter Tret1-like n=1 Tax=Penaeus japonicus TaxID=27405 RepID=UPI001C70C00C|nr:facilitated trehalose transporter Tret1-like [Penaeus japonicus]
MKEFYEIESLKQKDDAGDVFKGEEPVAVRRKRELKQLGLVSLVGLSYFSLGAMLPWPSPALSDMAENNATLVGTEITLTSAEKDMTGSLVYLGTLFGAWVAGILVSVVGRRRSLQLIVIPYIVGWLINGLAPNPPVLLTGRFILGLAGGMTTIAGYAFVVELSDAHLRGTMATIPTMGIVLGGLYTVSLGYVLPWHILAFVCILPPLLLLAGSSLLPESPSYLVVKGRRQQALVILRRLRGDYADVEAEVADLERRNRVGGGGGGGGWRDLLKADVLKRIAVVIVLFALMQLSGNFVFMIYTARVLQATGAPLDPDAITAIAGALKVGGTLAAILLMDRVGRRNCLIGSHAVNAACLLILGTYVYLAEGAEPGDDTYARLKWVPTVCVTVALFFCDIGVHPVPYVLSSEYFPTNLRAQASSICISAGTILTFLVLQLYSPMMELLTQAGLYWFYGATSVVGVVFCFVAVIETKGKAVG